MFSARHFWQGPDHEPWPAGALAEAEPDQAKRELMAISGHGKEAD